MLCLSVSVSLPLFVQAATIKLRLELHVLVPFVLFCTFHILGVLRMGYG